MERTPFEVERGSMVERQLRQRGICDERLLAAMSKVPRHEFVSQQNWGRSLCRPSGCHPGAADYITTLHHCRHDSGRTDQT